MNWSTHSYVHRPAFPGINLILVAELAGELGPIARYANAIAGRCGLSPPRSQSDQANRGRGHHDKRLTPNGPSLRPSLVDAFEQLLASCSCRRLTRDCI